MVTASECLGVVCLCAVSRAHVQGASGTYSRHTQGPERQRWESMHDATAKEATDHGGCTAALPTRKTRAKRQGQENFNVE